MQKNLALKTLFIIAVLLVFVYGIFGIPGSFSLDGLKDSLLKRIKLGLDLKGGAHLIFRVAVNEAVGAETDHVMESLKQELQKAKIGFTEVSKPDPLKQPDRIIVKGIATQSASDFRTLMVDKFQDYDLSSTGDGAYVVTMKQQAENELKNHTVTQSIDAIDQRINTLGLSESVVEEHGSGNYEILIQLPGVDDPAYIEDLLQRTGRLEIHHAYYNGQGYSSEADARATNRVLPADAVLMHGSNVGSDEGSKGDKVYVIARVPIVGGTDIRSAEAGTSPETNQPVVKFHLRTAAGKKFGDFTREHNMNTAEPSPFLAIVLENKIKEVARIKTEIGDEGEIEGGFTEQSAKELATLLNSGALPASLEKEEERSVGPSLGADSIRSGVRAAVAGMLAVMVFMLIYYRGAGINADLALFLNLVILLGFMGFTGATLTLPGIAGVILTVGMGVDSNVLIFERIREELRHGKAPASAVDQGFARAWITIIDTHVTTIVSAFILFIFGTGPVKGFAVTLTFGLLANLFTAVFVSRVIFDAILNRKQRGEALSI